MAGSKGEICHFKSEANPTAIYNEKTVVGMLTPH